MKLTIILLTFFSLPMLASERSAHEILGIAFNASKEEITQAFHAKALVCHPDKGGNADDFKILNQAYQKLMRTDSVPGIIKDFSKTKIRMPNFATILAVLNSNNVDGVSFLNVDRNATIACGLANQELSREEIVLFLFRKTKSRNPVEISSKVAFLISSVKYPGLEQKDSRK